MKMMICKTAASAVIVSVGVAAFTLPSAAATFEAFTSRNTLFTPNFAPTGEEDFEAAVIVDNPASSVDFPGFDAFNSPLNSTSSRIGAESGVQVFAPGDIVPNLEFRVPESTQNALSVYNEDSGLALTSTVLAVSDFADTLRIVPTATSGPITRLGFDLVRLFESGNVNITVFASDNTQFQQTVFVDENQATSNFFGVQILENDVRITAIDIQAVSADSTDAAAIDNVIFQERSPSVQEVPEPATEFGLLGVTVLALLTGSRIRVF
ncbi:MAG: hypothetical protein HC890_00640 [Chloroflexaceae bacterium]|nr:hypothetical protein [Chloroflexaceae bacterium]